MGFFSRAKDAAQQAAEQARGGQQGDGMVHVQGAGPVDPAAFGGPSTASVPVDDPIWEPISGVSLQDYAEVAKDAQARGVTDEAGMLAVAAERGFEAADFKAAMDGWVARMGQSMAVGQRFRSYLGY